MQLNKLLANINTVYVFGINLYLLSYITSFSLSFQNQLFLQIFSLLSLCFIFLQRKNFVLGSLVGTFFLIISLRLASLADLKILTLLWSLALIMQIIQFVEYMFYEISNSKEKNLVFLWQVIFIRIFVGYDLIPHFCEKLFAGKAVRAEDIKAFIDLGITDPLGFVFMAGVIEFLGSFAVSCGLLTRLSTVCLTIYLMVSTIMGHHFALGFIWATKGGGWEFPVLWSVIILTFAFTKPMLFSLDGLLLGCKKTPKFIKKIITVL